MCISVHRSLSVSLYPFSASVYLFSFYLSLFSFVFSLLGKLVRCVFVSFLPSARQGVHTPSIHFSMIWSARPSYRSPTSSSSILSSRFPSLSSLSILLLSFFFFSLSLSISRVFTSSFSPFVFLLLSSCLFSFEVAASLSLFLSFLFCRSRRPYTVYVSSMQLCWRERSSVLEAGI